ncbi:MAG: hypothetical protein COA84_01665 [Robiginitomaculum sp.]|nr:MAG: hypothetical protein COA84_01665 [Robiginitomaculum sp.]
MKIFALISLFSLLLAPPACAGPLSAKNDGKLYLSAVGEVSGTPDMASINAGVISEAVTAKAALASNRKQMNAVFAALKAARVKEKDIQTSGLTVNPIYAPYKQGIQPGKRITGYRVSNRVQATIRDLEGLGEAIDALVGAGANSIGGIAFGLSDAKNAENKARKDAMEKLLDKARVYASNAGVTLGPILELREGSAAAPYPRGVFFMSNAESKSAPTPIAAGQVSTRITVSATFKITPAQ